VVELTLTFYYLDALNTTLLYTVAHKNVALAGGRSDLRADTANVYNISITFLQHFSPSERYLCFTLKAINFYDDIQGGLVRATIPTAHSNILYECSHRCNN